MSTNYPNILTPPSSSEDSPQGQFMEQSVILPRTSLAFDWVDSAPAKPYLKIIEQPVDRFRFRYRSEMTGTHGSLCGENSDRARKQTYPTVELCNFNNRAIIRCSIYQHQTQEDHKPHAHRLIRKQGRGEVDDPHDIVVTPEDGYVCSFYGMGIIHTAKKNLVPELVRKKVQLKREEIARIEGKRRPLTQKEEVEIKGLADAESKSINLNVVCLRFDALFESDGILLPLCAPVYSHTINNLKSALTGELKIVRMDHVTSPAKGNREIYVLVERVTKKNIKIKFYELDDEDNVIWEEYGKFSDLDVHHQYAIVFKTPAYRDLGIKSPVKVYIELERPSDGARSEPREFRYIPSSALYKPGAKRARPSYESSSYDTSLNSDELPAPIHNLNIGNPILLDDSDMMVGSDDIQNAVNNINSDDFERLFSQFGPDYLDASEAAPEIAVSQMGTSSIVSLAMDAPASIPVKQRQIVIPEAGLPRPIGEDPFFAKQSIETLKNCIRTHPTDEKAIRMLRECMLNTHPLHTSIRHKATSDAMFLIKMLFVYKQYELVNMGNENSETALHIATAMNLADIVANLMACKAEPDIGDADGNNALHLAVIHNASIAVFESLLSVKDDKDIINAENNDGNTALALAIDNSNFRALKLLCLNGADINKQHKKNGYTPLRQSIEKENLEMIRYILQHKDVNPLIEDFQDINPFQAAVQKNNVDLVAFVKQYMRDNNYMDVEIKNEVEDEEEEDEEFEEKFAVKLERISQDELKQLYENVTDFTPSCLDDLASLLDKSGTWQNLADLLDLAHLMKPGLLQNKSPTKLLLKLAIETNGDKVLQIRDFLENLDEVQAVEVIDNMVKSQFYMN